MLATMQTFRSLGYQQLAAGSMAAATALTVPAGAAYAVIQVEAQAVRWRDDGTDPTAAIGMPVAVGTTFTYEGPLARIKFIEAAAGAILNVTYYG